MPENAQELNIAKLRAYNEDGEDEAFADLLEEELKTNEFVSKDIVLKSLKSNEGKLWKGTT